MKYTDREKADIEHLTKLREEPLFERLFQAYVSRQRFREPEVETALFHLSCFVTDGLYPGHMVGSILRPQDREDLLRFCEVGHPLKEEVQDRLKGQGILSEDGSLSPYCRSYVERELSLREVFRRMPPKVAKDSLRSLFFSELANEAARSNDDDS